MVGKLTMGWVACACCLLVVLLVAGANAEDTKPAANQADGYMLAWKMPANDFIVFSVFDLLKDDKGKPMSGERVPDDRVATFGRKITASGVGMSPLGWWYMYPEMVPFYYAPNCSQFRFLAYLPNAQKKQGDTWTTEIVYEQGQKFLCTYKFEKVIEVPNAKPDKGMHPEVVISGKAEFVPEPKQDNKPKQNGAPNYQDLQRRVLDKPYVFQWSVTYDPARGIITGGTLDMHYILEYDYFTYTYTLKKKAENPYDRDEYEYTLTGTNTTSYERRCKYEFVLEKYYRADHPEYLFLQEKTAVMDKGLAYLRTRAQKNGEAFCEQYQQHKDGQTALSVYTLLKCEAGIGDDAVLAGIDYLLQQKPQAYTEMYSVCLAVMALEEFVFQYDRVIADKNLRKKTKSAALDKKRVQAAELVMQALLKVIDDQFKAKDKRGWGYIKFREENANAAHLKRVDNSNLQFVALALNALERQTEARKIKVPGEYWKAIADYVLAGQQVNGGWDYGQDWKDTPPMNSARFTMTCAGLASLLFAKISLQRRGELSDELRVKIDAAVDKAKKFFDQQYTEWDEKASDLQYANYYYLYSLERACTLAKVSLVKNLDWYRENALVLFQLQRPDGRWRYENGHVVSTCFALLFLGRATVTMLRD